MRKHYKKGLILIVALMFILSLTTIATLYNYCAEVTNKQDVSVMTSKLKVDSSDSLLDEEKNLMDSYHLLLKDSCKYKDIEVIPGGESIGVKLSCEGILVVGFSNVNVNNKEVKSPAEEAGIEIGDIILKINNNNIETSSDLVSNIRTLKNELVTLQIKRNDKIINKKIKLIKEDEDDIYKIGLWVRDSTAGVGTLTFYHEDTKNFGALGHPVTDVDTNKSFSIKDGELLEASVISVRKGSKGCPGELKGIFVDCNNPIGEITKNTQCGIFGKCDKINMCRKEKMKVGYRNQIKEGKASILTSIDEEGPKEYEIEIVKLFKQDEANTKSMLIKVTDKKLLEKTGGIVQGMSGSPIIQNNKIVGAVTHVLINKPDVGYGIYIDWMLQDAGILD